MASCKTVSNLCFYLIDMLFSPTGHPPNSIHNKTNGNRLVKSSLKSLLAFLAYVVLKNANLRKMAFHVKYISSWSTGSASFQIISSWQPQNRPLQTTDITAEKTGLKQENASSCYCKEGGDHDLLDVDVDRVLWIPRKALNSTLISPGQWVSITLAPIPTKSLLHATTTTQAKDSFPALKYKVAVINGNYPGNNAPTRDLLELENSNEVSEDHQFITMTETGYYNLLRHYGIPPFELWCKNGRTLYELITVNIIPIVTTPTFPNSLEPLEGSPLMAKVVKLSKLKCNFNLSHVEGDLLIKAWFKSIKYLSPGDVISIPCNDINYQSSRVNSPVAVNFFVQEIDGNRFFSDEIENNGRVEKRRFTKLTLYSVSSQFTSLYLATEETNDFHVGISTLQLYQSVVDLVPNFMKPLMDKVTGLFYQSMQMMRKSHISKETSDPLTFTPDDNEIWSTFLLQGDQGTGKGLLVSSLATKLGLNFYSINATTLIGDTSAYTEGKLRALGEKVKSLLPCVVYIRNLQVLAKDKEGEEDKRVLDSFRELLIDLSTMNTSTVKLKIPKCRTEKGSPTSNFVESSYPLLPFFIGSTSKPEEMTGALRELFLHKLEMPREITGDEIQATLEWILVGGNVSLAPDIDLCTWSREAGQGVRRHFKDLQTFLAYAVREAYDKRSWKQKKGTDQISFSERIFANKLLLTEENLNHGLEQVDRVLRGTNSTSNIPSVKWEDVGGLQLIKSELISSIQLPLRFPQLFASGIKRSGILLYGPPGTGKTLIAKAVATEFKLSFLSVKGPELLNMYVGQSEQNVREVNAEGSKNESRFLSINERYFGSLVFEAARESAPCVLFFDELDSLAPNRGKSGDSGGVMDRVVSQILAELDGTHSTPNVFVIGATNRPDLIDPALLRPGRFDKLLFVGINEDTESKKRVLQALTRKFSLSPAVDLAEIAEKLPTGMTGADMYALCSDAYLTTVERTIKNLELSGDGLDTTVTLEEDFILVVDHCDFLAALSRASVSLSTAEQQKYEDLKGMMR